MSMCCVRSCTAAAGHAVDLLSTKIEPLETVSMNSRTISKYLTLCLLRHFCIYLPGIAMFLEFSALWISMEYLEGGSLQELMKTSKDNLDEHTTQWILKEILKVCRRRKEGSGPPRGGGCGIVGGRVYVVDGLGR